MSVAAAAPSISLSRVSGREAALWGVAGAAVLAMHLAVAYAFQAMRPLDTGGGPPPALMIELAPLPVAPATETEAFVPENVQPEQVEPVDDVEKVTEAEPEPVTEAEPEPVREEAEPVMEEVQPEEVAKAEPVEQESLEEVVPDAVEVETPEVAVPLPQPRPVVEEKPKAEKKPVEKVKERKQEKKKPATKPAAMASVQAKQAPRAAAQRQAESTSSSPSVSPARWQARLSAWLNRHKRYPSASRSKREEGTVQVAFTIDPSGRVTSSRVTRSSGNPELDKAALDMLRRASPVPAPPKEIAKPSMPVSVPVVFNLR